LPCATRRAGPAPPGDTLTLTTWRACNILAAANALGVKQELEKMLAQDGKPPRERQGDSVNETAQSETPHL
jgi:hypothetical protein